MKQILLEDLKGKTISKIGFHEDTCLIQFDSNEYAVLTVETFMGDFTIGVETEPYNLIPTNFTSADRLCRLGILSEKERDDYFDRHMDEQEKKRKELDFKQLDDLLKKYPDYQPKNR